MALHAHAPQCISDVVDLLDEPVIGERSTSERGKADGVRNACGLCREQMADRKLLMKIRALRGARDFKNSALLVHLGSVSSGLSAFTHEPSTHAVFIPGRPLSARSLRLLRLRSH